MVEMGMEMGIGIYEQGLRESSWLEGACLEYV